ncbi:glutamine--fructose-6-phosphate transaminase (isomerizing) [Eubacterium xylanophilum]|uniref:glutamine--fructose-6-phosphate transaminase (isomerizing) n=1 Tax=Eubacterium xylanophilum TaxID=39497 RepID=UPI000479E638|nr:glutamine--fructose-6-phosphate transaminase (isomerizing) [Eubacterium xylanophilum]
MCGIIGYVGTQDAKKALVDGLQTLEYRGYDSAGISFFTDNKIKTIKKVGKVSNLRENVKASASDMESHCGIGHTRWATHGGVSDTNSHPHTAGKVTLIHNGIIENYKELQDELAEKGVFPVSQTDSEIAAMVINDLYDGNPEEAIRLGTAKLKGAYGFCIMFEDIPDTIYAIRSGSPLVAAHTEKGSLIASDMVALVSYTKQYFVLKEGHLAKITKDEIIVKDEFGDIYGPTIHHISWDVGAAKKGGYDYFMMKEIHEQPESLRNTIKPRFINGLPDFTDDGVPDSLFEGIDKIVITACGTAMHAGLIGKNMIERLARIPVTVEIASEFRYQNPIINEKTLIITISQSGETADTLAAIALAKEHGCKTLSVVNVKQSSIARESDYVLYTHAGPEVAVASTKAYSVQLSVMYLLAFKLALITGNVSENKIREYTAEFADIANKVEETLSYDNQSENIAKRLAKAEDIFFIGRGLDYMLSCEGSLKLKEISYIHSEAYAAGELKHGTISLITDNVPVIALATQPDVYAKVISNVQEVRSRGAKVILITDSDASVDASLCDHQIVLPETSPIFTPFLSVVILQYLAYYVAVEKGLNVDQPRNLAKSVTVE